MPAKPQTQGHAPMHTQDRPITPRAILPGHLCPVETIPKNGTPIILDVGDFILPVTVVWGPAIGFLTPGMKGFVNLELTTQLVSTVASRGWMPAVDPRVAGLLAAYRAQLARETQG